MSKIVGDMIEALREARARGEAPPPAAWHELPAAHYRDPARLADEQRALFRRLPLVAGHDTELAPGTSLARDVAGVPLILARDAAGQARAFLNACRHRASRLCDDEVACPRKAFVCGYHGWTYDLGGRLLHVPHAEVFAGLELAARGLVEVPLAARHGLLWVVPVPGAALDLDAHLLGLDDELAAELADHVVFRRARTERRCNWKLVIDAFLEGYHIRHLHRDSVYRFFLDGFGHAERVGPHVRAVSARRTLGDTALALRDRATPSYLLFPNTVLVLHPDFVSVLVMTPLAVDRVSFEHTLLVPTARAGDIAHYDRSFALIDGGVFGGEDLVACEAVQRGLAAHADEHLIAGGLERAVPWFHDAIADAIASSGADLPREQRAEG
jgi:phenylpropionate dioxygenase-like ring-hydroxylating dioxygenase large terminal subunit